MMGAGVVHAADELATGIVSSGATWTSGTNCRPADTGAAARVKNPAVAKVSTTIAIAVNRVNSPFKICPPLCVSCKHYTKSGGHILDRK